MNDFWPLINNVTFTTFTLCRIISFPIIVLYEIYGMYMLYDRFNTLQIICMLIQFANFIWMLMLNIGWYRQILRGLRKMLQAKGIIAPDPPKPKKDEPE